MRSAIGISFVIGILIAGSDGPWFPWGNLVGAVIFAIIIPLSWRIK